jgi:hypothetical protein
VVEVVDKSDDILLLRCADNEEKPLTRSGSDVHSSKRRRIADDILPAAIVVLLLPSVSK